MQRCLYCDQIPRSEEHPLPVALGEIRDGPTLLNRICKQCNERRIGILDEQLVRCGPIAVLRKTFDIQGRQHHDKVNPFYRGSAGGQRVRFLAWDDAFQSDVLIELTGGNQARQLSGLAALVVTPNPFQQFGRFFNIAFWGSRWYLRKSREAVDRGHVWKSIEWFGGLQNDSPGGRFRKLHGDMVQGGRRKRFAGETP